MTTSVRTFFLVLLFGLAARGEPGRVSHAVTQRPFYFEANEGRYEPAVRFVARTPSGSMFVMDDGMVLDVFGSTPIRVRFPRSGAKVVIEGVDPLPTRTHHFIGADPSGWKRNLAVFRRVRVSHLHPGIPVEHYRGPNGLEHDYIVDPGADPGRIRFTIEGGDRTGLAANGDLLVHAGDDVVRFHKPTIYQQAGPDRDLVEGEYVRAGPAEFGFHIENYDASRPLIIDPVLSAPTVFGGSDAERLNAVDVDNAGNIYVTGSTRSADFPTRNPLFPNAAGETDVFIVKFDPTAQNMIWATFLGGSAFDSGQGLAVGPGGGVHVVGNTSSADFPLRDAMQQNHGGGSDGFVVKLNTDGDVLEWSTFLGGAGSDSARAVEIDLAGNILIGGETSSADFPATAGALSETLGGGQDCFVSKLASSGQGLIFSTFLGGGGRDSCSAIALTKDGEVAIVGASDSTDFPATAGAFQPALNPKPSPRFPTIDFADAVVLNADGTDLVYGSYFGGADDDFASAVAIDPTGKVWLGGGTSSADFPVTPDADQSTPLGDSNAWIARLDPGSAAAALRSDRLGRREQGTAAFYLSLMPAARLGALAIITAATGIGDFQLLAALVNFFPNSERESILVLLTATGGQSLEFPPVEGRVNAVTASEQGAVVVAETNGQNSNAMLSTITVEQTEGGTNLDISKTADPEKVATGAEVLYTIKVFNRGPEEAENVVVIDTLPSNSAVIGDLPDKCIGKGPQVICDLGTVPVGGVGVSRVFEVRAPAQPGTMVNTARIEGSGSAEAQTVVEEGLDVQIELTGLDDLLNGQEVVFKLKITNHGPPLATDVNVVFPVQPPIELQDPFYSSDRARGTCERKDTNPFALLRPTEVRCELAELAAGENWNIDVMGRAGPLEALASYEAEVGSREADTNRSNNSTSNTLIVRGNSAADVAVVPVSLSIGPSGGHHTVKVNVKNFGVSSATNVQLTVEAGSGVDLSELGTEAYRNGSFGGCGDSGTCKLSFGDIGALDTVTSLLTFDSSAKNISIVFRVSANEPDPNPTNNQILYEEPLPKVLTRAALGDGSQHGKQQILEPPSPILPPPAAVTNSAAGNNFDTVSAGSGHTVWGTGFSSNVRVADGSERMPIDLDGVKVRLNGIPAPLFFVAPNQINFQTPWELLRDRLAEVRVEVHAATTMPFFVRVAIHDPGIFTTNQSGSGQGAILIANSASLAAPAGMFPGSQPVARGGFVSIFCNGLGPVSDPPPTGAGAWTDRLASTQTLPVVTVDGLDAPVFFSGLAPGFVGLYQVNAQIPEGASTGDAVDLSVTIGGIESNGVTIAISE